MRITWLFVSMAVGAMICTGCAPSITVSAHGKRQPDAQLPRQVTYTVFPTAEVDKDPHFSRYARLVSQKMEEHGYQQTESRSAQLGVYLAYVQQEMVVPAQSDSVDPRQAMSTGMASRGAGSTQYGGTVTPSGGPSGPRYVSQAVLVVADLPKSRSSGELVELWRGETWTTGDNELAAMMPLLIDAAFSHFGEGTAAPVEHIFSAEQVQNLRARHTAPVAREAMK